MYTLVFMLNVEGGTCHSMHVDIMGQFMMSVIVFYLYMGSGNETQVTRLL